MTAGPRFFAIPIGNIDPPTSNPRFEPKDLDDLIDSIRGVGILEPLICVGTASGRVRLVAGLRRFTAAQRVGLPEVPCIVHPRLTPQEELAISLVENLHRKDMSPVERGEAFVKLAATGLSRRAIGKMVGLSDMSVTMAITIATKLIPEAKAACHAGELTQDAAWRLATMPQNLQRAVFFSEPAKPGPKGPLHRDRTTWESCARDALKAIHFGDRQLALTLLREAVASLEECLDREGAAA